MNQREFPVRPRPLPNESFVGYVMRVGLHNGRYTIACISNAVGMQFDLRTCLPDGKAHSKFVAKLAGMLRLEATDLEGRFRQPEQNMKVQDRMIKDIRFRNVKFCPFCLSDNGFFSSLWENSCATHCATHQVQLIDKCPECEHRFNQWNANYHLLCIHCGCSWSQLDRRKFHSEVPLYQMVALSKPHALTALINTVAITLRPLDHMYRAVPRIEMNITDWVRHLRQAFQLLSCEPFRKSWCSQVSHIEYPIFDNRRLPDALNILQEQFWAGQPSKLETSDTDELLYVQHENDSVISNERLVLEKNGVPAHHHIGIHEVALHLDIKSSCAKKLVDRNLIPKVNNPCRTGSVIIDIETIAELKKSIFKRVESKHKRVSLIQLRDVGKNMRFFGLTRGDLLQIILTTKIPLYSLRGAAKNWLDLWVNMDRIYLILDLHYTEYWERPLISKNQLCAMLREKPEYVDWLVTIIPDFAYAPDTNEEFFELDTVKKLLRRYMFVSRWLRVFGFLLNSFQGYLVRKSLKPLYGEGFAGIYDANQLSFAKMLRLNMYDFERERPARRRIRPS
ncbi:MAG: TniQ family protein [Pararheinheimera sp.]|nr:TniQ family protein [Rheinheimera sp.]